MSRPERIDTSSLKTLGRCFNLSGPGGRLRLGRTSTWLATFREFQSSAAPEDGCDAGRTGPGSFASRGFNPQPPRRTAATWWAAG